MERLTVDVAIIGAGTAGLAAYRASAAAGKRTILIGGGPYGTTCARVGCMPSKLLIAAAEAAHGVERWQEFGLRLEGALRIDGQAVMSRVKRERDRFVGFVLQGVEAMPPNDRVDGFARFIDDHTLAVDDRLQITFSQAVIAAGSSPSIPPQLRAAGNRLLVNDDIFAWDDLPRSVAVFGPGVIGLELGQALHRLGVEVLMFGRKGHVGSFSDPTIRAYAARTFAHDMHLDIDGDVDGVELQGDAVLVRYRGKMGEPIEARVDYVIATTGRRPNVGQLGLANTTLQLDAHGVPLFDRRTMQCGTSPIFIAGDVNDHIPLLHEAADQGRIAGENAARFPDVQPGLRRTPLAIVFSDPQLAIAGARFVDLKPGTFVVGSASFENQGRSRILLRHKGLMHVYADITTGRLVGSEMIAPDAEHLGHLLSWAIQGGWTVEQTLAMPFYHPVIEEGMRTALRDAHAALVVAQSESAQRRVA
jgi:dihydrolipoamide dehydrogenase